jgi:hypothetical protein
MEAIEAVLVAVSHRTPKAGHPQRLAESAGPIRPRFGSEIRSVSNPSNLAPRRRLATKQGRRKIDRTVALSLLQ